jgi:selenocysteine-specific elongation factor
VARERAERARDGDALARAVVALEAIGAQGLTREELVARAGWSARESAAVWALGPERFVAASVVQGVERGVLESLSAFHAAQPTERGADRRHFATLGPDAVVDLALSGLMRAAKVSRDGEVYARAGWKPRGLDDVPFVAQVRAAILRAGVAAPTRAELLVITSGDAKALDAALRRLLERREVVRVSADFVASAEALAALEARVVAHIEAHGTIDAQAFKEISGLTRKHAIPTLEHFDAKKLTLRVGDVRKLRGR